MNVGSTGKLYTPQLLGLATQLAAYPFDRAFGCSASRRSRSCGSTIAIGMDLDPGGRISSVGMKVSACAVGQASAAVLADFTINRTPHDLELATRSIERWLAFEAGIPDLPNFGLLAGAQDFYGRHDALLLPWKAGCDALFNAPRAG